MSEEFPVSVTDNQPDTIDVTFADELPGESTELVQKQLCGGVWLTVCNICHSPIPAPHEMDGSNRDEDISAGIESPVCYEVIPCHVALEQTCLPWGAVGDEENWYKRKSRAFVVCQTCWRKLQLRPTKLPTSRRSISPKQGDVMSSTFITRLHNGLEDWESYVLAERINDSLYEPLE